MSEELTKYTVEVTYTFHLEAVNKYQAEGITDYALLRVNNPQTSEEIIPEIEVYEET